MAWATRCDRCGQFFDHHLEATNGFAFLSYDRLKDRYEIDGDEHDLCPDCVEALSEWFDPDEKYEI